MNVLATLAVASPVTVFDVSGTSLRLSHLVNAWVNQASTRADSGWHLDVVAISSIALALVAIAFALKQYRDAKKTMTRLEEVAKTLSGVSRELKDVEQGLSTRYLAVFPKFMRRLNEVLESAEASIEILCDVPAYGIFSDHVEWTRYSHILEDKSEREGFDLSMTFLHPDVRHQQNLLRFARARNNWARWKNELEIQANLKVFLRRFEDSPSPAELTPDQFESLLERADADAAAGVFSRAKKHEIKAQLPVYYWLVDNRTAIFAIATYDNPSSEYGFTTTDVKLISAFSEMRRQYREYPANSKPTSTPSTVVAHGVMEPARH